MSEQVTEEAPPLDESIIAALSPHVDKWESEVRNLLPALPYDVHIHWFSGGPLLMKAEGVGGFAYDHDSITLVYDPNFSDKEKQLQYLKGTDYHESFHLVQGYVGSADHTALPPIGNAIYEGAATVFERERAGTDPSYGQYPDVDVVNEWIQEIKTLPLDYDWKAWKRFHPEKKQAHIMYKAGTYIVDEALKNSPDLTIENLATMGWEEILELSRL